jgi:hypothetical protein
MDAAPGRAIMKEEEEGEERRATIEVFEQGDGGVLR